MVLLFLAPIVVASISYSSAILPLFAAPILAIYNAGRQAVRKRRESRRVSREHQQRARTPRECECFRVGRMGLGLGAVPAQRRQRRLDRADGVVNGRLLGLAR